MATNVEMKRFGGFPEAREETPNPISKVQQLASMNTSFFGDRLTANLDVVSFADFYIGKFKAFFRGDLSHLLYDSKQIEAAVTRFFRTNMKTLADEKQISEKDMQQLAHNIETLGISKRVSILAHTLNTLCSSTADVTAQAHLRNAYRLDDDEDENTKDANFREFVLDKGKRLGMVYNFKTGKFE